jgi:putative hydrolase of the HAD superfamily
MSPSPVACLLLDVGRVLIDLDYQTLADRMRSITGLEPVQLQAMLSADSLVRKLETGKMQGVQFYEEVCRRTGIRIAWPEFLASWNSILGAPLISEEMIAALARNARLWVVSNTNDLHFDHMMRHFVFPRYCEGFVLSHEVGALKPDPRVFLHALEKVQVDPSAVLFVDDQEGNVTAAQALGIPAFQFLSLGQFETELKLRGVL